MLHQTRRPRPLFSLLSLVVVTACCPPPPPEPPEPPTLSALTLVLRAFPCDSISSTEMTALQEMLADTLHGNEVHDCQKLIRGGAFGPLVGVYPLPVDTLETFEQPRVVATVFDWGADYEPLGIRRDWNCLWLVREHGVWRAVMTLPVGDSCKDAAGAMRPGGLDLVVDRRTHSGTAPYPQTARWGWDENLGVHYIGLRCGRAWCAIGPDGFRPREQSLGRGGVSEVPGWYDDQRLAIPGPDGTLIPGPWGKIEPVPDLDTITVEQYRRPQDVAFVTLNGTASELTHYEQRWNMHEGRNRIQLQGQDDDWVMIVHSSTGIRKEFPVTRWEETLHAVEGAVRWRWDDRDESAWIGCKHACCSPQ